MTDTEPHSRINEPCIPSKEQGSLAALLAAGGVSSVEALKEKRLSRLDSLAAESLAVRRDRGWALRLKTACPGDAFLPMEEILAAESSLPVSYASKEASAGKALEEETAWWEGVMKTVPAAEKESAGAVGKAVLATFSARYGKEKAEAAKAKEAAEKAYARGLAGAERLLKERYEAACAAAYEKAGEAESSAATAYEFMEAYRQFDKLGLYADARERKYACERKAAEAAAAAEKKLRRRKLMAKLALPALAVLYAAYLFGLKPVITRAAAYRRASVLMEAEEYEQAAGLLKPLGSYRESKERLAYCLEAVPVRDYAAAMALYEQGEYASAASLFITLRGYKDVDALLESDAVLKEAAEKAETVADEALSSGYLPGCVVRFGTYEQDNNPDNGPEEVEWLVLAREGNAALLLSRYALDCRQYNEKYGSVSWETSSLRAWLNGPFLDKCFTPKEQVRILVSEVSADKNPVFKTDPGSAVADRIFLLSFAEAEKYLPSRESRMCRATKYAESLGAYLSPNRSAWWWLRTPGGGRVYATFANYLGILNETGCFADIANLSVRPALWVQVLPD